MTDRDKWALISVFYKDRLLELAQGLTEAGIKLVASTGTADKLVEGGFEVLRTETLTGFAEMFDHRLVTLNHVVHGGILARPDNEADQKDIQKHGIKTFDLVITNFYPFSEVAASGASYEECIEKIDIGGPAMVRAAAKNNKYVGIVTDPSQYDQVLQYLREEGSLPADYRRKLFIEAFARTAAYDLAIVEHFSEGEYKGLLGQKVVACDYGENREQSPAALYRNVVDTGDKLTLDKYELIAGRMPSYINWTDLDRLQKTLTRLAAGHQNFGGFVYLAVAVKHGNPCGVGVGHTPEEATQRMLEGNLRAVFGAVVVMNFPVTEGVAQLLLHHKKPEGAAKRLLDGICAPSFDVSPETLKELGRKDGKYFLATNEELANLDSSSLDQADVIRQVRGGFLAQPSPKFVLDPDKAETQGELVSGQARNLITAQAVCATSNSNTISVVKDDMLVANGVGQQDRVGCCELAVRMAAQNGHDLTGAVAASDSFFPFSDGPQVLIDAGVTAIFSTTGSNNDADTQQLCAERGVALMQLPDAEARAFFGH